MAPIVVGEATNLQDATIVHVDEGKPARIGARVGVGHRVILHACTVEDDCLIGMGSILLNDVHVGTGSVIAAGAVVPEGMRVPPGSLVMGGARAGHASRRRWSARADSRHLGALRRTGRAAPLRRLSGRENNFVMLILGVRASATRVFSLARLGSHV